MNRRRKNNIVIGTLCAVLVLMGVGYAILSTTLNIGGTANIKGDFDIHFLTEDDEYTENNVQKRGITLIDYENSTSSNTVYKTTVSSLAATMEASTGVDTQDPTRASFSAILQKPTDYATFTAIAKNYGTIKGKISTITITSTPSQELSDWLSINGGTYSDYFEVTTTAQQNTILNPGGEYDFSVTVRFKESATKLPQGSLENEIVITYVQANEEQQGPIAYVDQDDSCFISFIDGEINYYDTSKQGCGSSVTIPENLRLKKSTLTGYTFNNQLCLAFAPDIKDKLGYGSASDQQFCSGVESTIAGLYSQGQSNLYDTYFGAFITPTYTTPTDADGTYNLITKVGAGSFAVKNISSLSLSNNITQIKANGFAGNTLTTLTIPNSVTSIGDSAFAINSSLASVNLGTGVTTLGDSAFAKNSITTLTIPNSVTSIGDSAFAKNSITTLDLSNATSLKTIEKAAFEYNQITSLNFNSAISLESIGEYAFKYNSITGTIKIPSNLVTISEGAFGADSYSAENHNNITGLDLSDATHLTTIGSGAFCENNISNLTIPSSIETIGISAFYDNSITTLDLSNATNLSSIGNYAFYNQIDKNDSSIHTLQSINASNKTKAQYDTISNNNEWYDSGHTNFHIQYSDQCVGNGCN